jgi:choline kinase
MKSWKFWAMDNTELAHAMPKVALILAAGFGSRLRPQTKTPKPLTRVLGLSLAERVVCMFGPPTTSSAVARVVSPATKCLRIYTNRPRSGLNIICTMSA